MYNVEIRCGKTAYELIKDEIKGLKTQPNITGKIHDEYLIEWENVSWHPEEKLENVLNYLDKMHYKECDGLNYKILISNLVTKEAETWGNKTKAS